MTPSQIALLRKKFPNAPESFFKRQIEYEDSHNNRPRLRPAAPQPASRVPLADGGIAEDPHWYDAAKRFEIRFTVYSVRPADWDGYYVKALQDFLVRAGIIPEDRWDVIVGATIHSKKAATEREEKTVVEIITADEK